MHTYLSLTSLCVNKNLQPLFMTSPSDEHSSHLFAKAAISLSVYGTIGEKRTSLPGLLVRTSFRLAFLEPKDQVGNLKM